MKDGEEGAKRKEQKGKNLNDKQVVVIRRRRERVKVSGGVMAAFAGRREERVNRLQSDKEGGHREVKGAKTGRRG